MAEQLYDVRELQASSCAFAALRGDGHVVTWGPKAFGGDSSEVRHLLGSVLSVVGSRCAFSALREDGKVVTWGKDWAGDGDRFIDHHFQPCPL